MVEVAHDFQTARFWLFWSSKGIQEIQGLGHRAKPEGAEQVISVVEKRAPVPQNALFTVAHPSLLSIQQTR